MTTESSDYTLSTIDSMASVTASEWSRLGGAAKASQSDSSGSHQESGIVYNPFVSHAFLSSLEESGSVSAQTGWLPRHIVLRAPDGALEGAMPAYIKSHSMGEYVFDHAWADAFERAGGRYYPKLQCSAPFTPATGPRLMVTPGPGDASRAARAGCRAGDHCAANSACHRSMPPLCPRPRLPILRPKAICTGQTSSSISNQSYRDLQ
jgi:predicted N-acyltransferase